MLEVIKNKIICSMDEKEFLQKVESFSQVMIDIGTGDGKFPYGIAKKEAKTLCIGIDSNADAMKHISWKMNRQPSKGGLETSNLFLFKSDIENLPLELNGIANFITINYPWSKLLISIVQPIPEILKKITFLAKDKAEIKILLNYSVFDDEIYIKKLGLPKVNLDYVDNVLKPIYEKESLFLNKYYIVENDSVFQTSWGKKLSVGSGRRKTLCLEGNVLKS